ncbi:DUF2851 family protein [Bacteroides sp. OttesenSCG-928-E20]|nr:DUF2851 family protein [Bacteroides sp. OttesenSCG-928-N06]MDL2299495.1 DUF2851 family protein [Bacteroides sp. OttesenSCG-928-E20]MDL2304666.1 DUF2851 family protein [Bacteroides sp. OttesenSCG-928-D19]
MEQLLHYVWKHKIFPLQELQTTSGQCIEVIDTGLANYHAGPDFFNAKIKIDGTLWIGNVEIHTISSDWKRHGHHTDRTYDSVILHVTSEIDCPIYRTNGEEIPQMQLKCPQWVSTRYEELKKAEMRPPCYSIIPSLSKLTVHSWFSALQSERFEEKTRVIKKRLAELNNHWEDAFFITLARNFGFGLNGDAFELWAKQIPFRAVDKHRDNLFQVEAFFFGQAGLLETNIDDEYYKNMQKEFGYLQHKFNFTHTVPDNWKFMRLRPGNFPHVRIAQLAYFYHKEQALFSRVMEAKTVEAVKSIFKTQTSAYWEEHYNFSKTSPQKEKKLGQGSLNLIVINTIVPFLYAYGLYTGNEELCHRASTFLENLKAENNYITKRWDGTGIPVFTAADSQALIQLQKEYCDKKKCLYCRFGYEYLKNK